MPFNSSNQFHSSFGQRRGGFALAIRCMLADGREPTGFRAAAKYRRARAQCHLLCGQLGWFHVSGCGASRPVEVAKDVMIHRRACAHSAKIPHRWAESRWHWAEGPGQNREAKPGRLRVTAHTRLNQHAAFGTRVASFQGRIPTRIVWPSGIFILSLRVV